MTPETPASGVGTGTPASGVVGAFSPTEEHVESGVATWCVIPDEAGVASEFLIPHYVCHHEHWC